MKTLYLECRMGAAGDMLTAALSELVDQKKFTDHMNSIGLEGITFRADKSVKCGITGTHMSVMINGEEEESHDVHHDHHGHHHHDHDHHHDHTESCDHGHHSSSALFKYHIEGLNPADADHLQKQISGIHDISEVSLDGETGILTYVYDHDHNDHCEEHIQEVLAACVPGAVLTAAGHEHHHDHGHHHDHDHGHHEHHHEHDHTESCDHGHHDHEHHHEHHHGHHHHAGMHEIHHILEHLNISDEVRKNAEAVYALIAEAESHAHAVPVDQIHFHEVGTMDAIADVVAVCTLMEWIAPERIYASPVAVGNGMVRCAHGILPVPAPATAYLLQGIPSYAGRMQGELCTPTGAALLKHFVDSFESMPEIVTEKIGYGMGKKDFEAANCVRAFLGECSEDGEVVELVCNLDDISAEAVGYAVDELFAAGALDVYTTPVHMKKNRPGIVFTCACRMNDKDRMVSLMFRHLTTLGIREYTCRRHAMKRSVEKSSTSMGEVRIKRSEGFGTVRKKLEFDDLARIARENDIPVETVRRILEKELGM